MILKQFFLVLILISSICSQVFSQDCVVNVVSENGLLKISNLQQDANVKLFDAAVQAVWTCNPWAGSPCTEDEEINGLIIGNTYFLSVQSNICNEWIPVVINENLSAPTCFDGIQNQGETAIDCGGPCAPCPISSCNVDIVSDNGVIQVTGLPTDANTKLFTTDNLSIWECNPWNGSPCSDFVTISGVTTGENYFLSIQNALCEDWIAIAVTGCPDADGDGICDDVDCNPQDSTLPGNPGAACDDSNALTENDVISADGCSCAGIFIEPIACEVDLTVLANSADLTGLSPNANAKLFDSDFNIVWSCDPWTGTPCTSTETISNLVSGAIYSLSVQSIACDVWLPFMTEGQVANVECSKFLGDFSDADCFEFLGNGNLRLNVETEDGAYNQLLYNEFGELISSTPVTKANSVALEGDRIIERNSFGSIVRDVPIDPSIITMYNQSGGKLHAVARFQGNKFVLAGGVPEGGAGNEPFLDQLYVHEIGATGSLISSEVFTEIQYTEQDYQFYGGNFYDIEAIIPVAQGNNGGRAFEIYIKKFESELFSEFLAEIIRYDLDVNFEVINEEVIDSNDNEETFIDLLIEADLCTEDRFEIVCFSSDFQSGASQTEVEIIDHGFFQPFLRSNILIRSDDAGVKYELETDYILNGGSIIVSGNAGANGLLFPGEYTYGVVGFDGVYTEDGVIVFNEPPVGAFKKLDGSYNFITETNGSLTWYTTACTELPENTPQSFEAEKVDDLFVINNLFPNPTDGEIFLKIESTSDVAAQIDVYNVTGIKVMTKYVDLEIGINTYELNLDQLRTGVYNLVVNGNGNQIQSKRFVKK